MSKSTRLVLFDIDGTLLRGAGGLHKQALIEGVRSVMELETNLEGISTAGTLDRVLIELMVKKAGCSARRYRSMARAVWDECQKVYVANCNLDLTPFLCPGVRPLLETLRGRQVPMGLVTGNLSQIGWRKMELAGLRAFFSFGAFAEDGRTRARLAQLAAGRARRSGLITRTASITLIGDHTNDVLAAKRNGFQSIGVATGFTPAEDLRSAGADIVIDSFEELAAETLL